MNNEPVAWIIESDEEFKNGKNYPTLDWYVKDILNLPIGTKLYTHPVKELTDDVVNELWAESQEDGIAMQQGFTTQQHYFAHLILRKASE